MDPGAESSLISESLAQRLRLKRSAASTRIFGVGGRSTCVSRGVMDLKISGRTGAAPIDVTALILPQLTRYIGRVQADRRGWDHLNGLELADPEFLAIDPVDLLLGADVYAVALEDGLRKGESYEPVAQKTRFVWILMGAVGEQGEVLYSQVHQCRVEEPLGSLVQQFWRQEEVGLPSPPLSAVELECEESFVRTHSRDSTGRYIVRLPMSGPLPDLSGTRHSAVRAFSRMAGRFTRDNRLRQLYHDFMLQYERLGHMTPVTPGTEGDGAYCFLPHHGVVRESSSTTKLRVVFNGSAPVASGESLNKHLLVGTNLLPALVDILLRWRAHRYVLAADIEKMYRQILVDPQDRRLQRIVWQPDEHSEVATYQLNTVTYGLACAPFLAMRTVRQLAADEEGRFPLGSAILRADVYMDDILTGASSVEEAQELQHQLTDLCMAGGFPLRKWSANCPEILSGVPLEHRMLSERRSWQPQDSHSTLGLQ